MNRAEHDSLGQSKNKISKCKTCRSLKFYFKKLCTYACMNKITNVKINVLLWVMVKILEAAQPLDSKEVGSEN